MRFSETLKKCLQYSIDLSEGKWKLNLVTRGTSGKKFEALVQEDDNNL